MYSDTQLSQNTTTKMVNVYSVFQPTYNKRVR